MASYWTYQSDDQDSDMEITMVSNKLPIKTHGTETGFYSTTAADLFLESDSESDISINLEINENESNRLSTKAKRTTSNNEISKTLKKNPFQIKNNKMCYGDTSTSFSNRKPKLTYIPNDYNKKAVMKDKRQIVKCKKNSIATEACSYSNKTQGINIRKERIQNYPKQYIMPSITSQKNKHKGSNTFPNESCSDYPYKWHEINTDNTASLFTNVSDVSDDQENNRESSESENDDTYQPSVVVTADNTESCITVCITDDKDKQSNHKQELDNCIDPIVVKPPIIKDQILTNGDPTYDFKIKQPEKINCQKLCDEINLSEPKVSPVQTAKRKWLPLSIYKLFKKRKSKQPIKSYISSELCQTTKNKLLTATNNNVETKDEGMFCKIQENTPTNNILIKKRMNESKTQTDKICGIDELRLNVMELLEEHMNNYEQQKTNQRIKSKMENNPKIKSINIISNPKQQKKDIENDVSNLTNRKNLDLHSVKSTGPTSCKESFHMQSLENSSLNHLASQICELNKLLRELANSQTPSCKPYLTLVEQSVQTSPSESGIQGISTNNLPKPHKKKILFNLIRDALKDPDKINTDKLNYPQPTHSPILESEILQFAANADCSNRMRPLGILKNCQNQRKDKDADQDTSLLQSSSCTSGLKPVLSTITQINPKSNETLINWKSIEKWYSNFDDDRPTPDNLQNTMQLSEHKSDGDSSMIHQKNQHKQEEFWNSLDDLQNTFEEDEAKSYERSCTTSSAHKSNLKPSSLNDTRSPKKVRFRMEDTNKSGYESPVEMARYERFSDEFYKMIQTLKK